MNCRRCGAKIKKNTEKCIYCGTPVRNIKLYKKNKAFADGKGKTLFIIGVLLIALSVGVIAVMKINDGKALKHNTDSLVTLERYFRSKDYEMIYQYIAENKVYGDDFDKYVEIYEVYGYRKSALAQVKNINFYDSSTSADTFKYSIQSVMSNCLLGIKEAKRCIYDGYELGNEDMLEYLIQNLKKLMRDNLKLDGRTVDEMCELSAITDVSLSTYVKDTYDILKR